MDVTYINPFLQGTLNVLEQMAFVKAVPGKPFVKEGNAAIADVSGIIGITGDATGSLAISFTESCICQIVENMLGERHTSIDNGIIDAVGEITNMISGVARNFMEKDGIKAFAAIPTVVYGKNHTITTIYSIPSIVIPFSTPSGPFFVDVCLKTTLKEERKAENYRVINVKTAVGAAPQQPAEDRQKGVSEPEDIDRGALLRNQLQKAKAQRDEIEQSLTANPFMELAKRRMLKNRLIELDTTIRRLKLDISTWSMLSKMTPEEKFTLKLSKPPQPAGTKKEGATP